MPHFEWIRPPWRTDRPEHHDDPGQWPWCGDKFLAAVRVVEHTPRGNNEYWEYWVLSWSETGLEHDGEPWFAWDESDIDWIARIPAAPAEK